MNNSVVDIVLDIFNNDWNKQVILYGPPGTSKTYSATIIAAAMLTKEKEGKGVFGKISKALEDIADFLSEEEKKKLNDNKNDLYTISSIYLKHCDNYKLVQFHPSYSYEDFVRGIKVKPMESDEIVIKGSNDITYTIPKGKSGSGVKYEVEPKIIESFCNKNIDKTKVLVIDEINRAPLASVLGELIYGLEYRGEKISTPYEIKEGENTVDLVIPDNLYIIGTMNTADRSIGTMDYAVRRRFAFVPVPSEPAVIKCTWNHIGEIAEKLYNDISKLFDVEYLEDKELDSNDIKIGHTYFLGKKGMNKEQEIDYLKYRFDYQIKPIYMEYVKDGIVNRNGEEAIKNININNY